MLGSSKQRVSRPVWKTRLSGFDDVTFQERVVRLRVKLSHSGADTSLQTASFGSPNVEILAYACWLANQLNHISKAIIEPSNVASNSIAPERLFDTHFPALRSLGQKVRIPKKERARAEVLA